MLPSGRWCSVTRQAAIEVLSILSKLSSPPISCWEPQLRDGHIRRKALGPHHRRLLDWHASQVRAELDLEIEFVVSLAQFRHQRRPEDLFDRSEIESSPLNAGGWSTRSQRYDCPAHLPEEFSPRCRKSSARCR